MLSNVSIQSIMAADKIQRVKVNTINSLKFFRSNPFVQTSISRERPAFGKREDNFWENGFRL